MTSIYSLIPRLRIPNIKGGEPIELEIYITGYGNIVKSHKLQITYSSSNVFAKNDEGKVGYIEYCIKVAKNQEGKIIAVLSGNKEYKDENTNEMIKAIHSNPLDYIGTTVFLHEGHFMSRNEVMKLSGKEVDEKDLRILGETTHDGHPPILLHFNTLNNATPGDYNIYLTLFYSDESDLKMDQKIVTFHINHWIEQHQKMLQYIAVFLGLSAVISGIIQAVYTYLQYLLALALK